MSSEERITRVINEHKQPVTVKLTKGAKGVYRWEIQVNAESPLQALMQIYEIDQKLRHRYSHPQPNPMQQHTPSLQAPEDPHRRMDIRLKRVRGAAEKSVNWWED